MPAPVITKTCGAKTRAGTPCPNPPVHGRERCRLHGGKTREGVAHPAFVHGLRAKAHSLPSRLAATYQASLTDPELISLRNEIALSDARIQDLLDRVDSGESGELWKSLSATFAEARKNQHAANLDTDKRRAFWDAFDSLGFLIAEGSNDYRAWEEVHSVVEQRRKLADSERGRLKDLNAYITAEKAIALVTGMLGIIKRHVPDRSALQRIQSDVARLVTGDDRGGTGPGAVEGE